MQWLIFIIRLNMCVFRRVVVVVLIIPIDIFLQIIIRIIQIRVLILLWLRILRCRNVILRFVSRRLVQLRFCLHENWREVHLVEMLNTLFEFMTTILFPLQLVARFLRSFYFRGCISRRVRVLRCHITFFEDWIQNWAHS